MSRMVSNPFWKWGVVVVVFFVSFVLEAGESGAVMVDGDDVWL